MADPDFTIACSRCAYGAEPMEPRLLKYGWEHGLVLSTAFREWFAADIRGPRPEGPVYVKCPRCNGTCRVACDAEEYVRSLFVPERADAVVEATKNNGKDLTAIAYAFKRLREAAGEDVIYAWMTGEFPK